MRKIDIRLFVMIMLAAVLSSCSSNTSVPMKTGDEKEISEAPLYSRKTVELSLEENANLYRISWGMEGFFYFVMEPEGAYQFYYQTYDGKKADLFCELTEGYVRAFDQRVTDKQKQLVVLHSGEETYISEYDKDGKRIKQVRLDERLGSLEEIPAFSVLPEGGYVIALGTTIYFLSPEGEILQERTTNQRINDFLMCDNRELYAATWKNEKTGTSKHLLKIGIDGIQELEDFPQGAMEILAYGEGVVLIFADRIDYYDIETKELRPLVDLERQSILAGQIKAMYEEDEEIHLMSMESAEETTIVLSITLSEKSTDETQQAGNTNKDFQKEEKAVYAPDGRRMVYIAVPDEYEISIEYHAKKYNQKNDSFFVQIERFQGPLEDYLGKGNRPDVIMLRNHTEVSNYVEKKMLVDFIPMFAGQETYSLEDILPKAREVLGAESMDGMYAMAGRFNLLLRSSTGEEDVNGWCDTVSYLKWYERYLTEKEIVGMNELYCFFYAVLPEFYDEKTAQSAFDTEKFKELSSTYREVWVKHRGEYKRNKVYWEYGSAASEISQGPQWMKNYFCGDFVEQTVQKKGLPGIGGQELIYISMDYPMSILSTSECREGAFEFILYFCSLNELAHKGDEAGYGLYYNTKAEFSTFESALKEEIFETEKCFGVSHEQDSSGMPIKDKYVELYYTKEQLDQLRYLIDNAIPTTKTQEDIYGMFLEEMTPYFNGEKDLDRCCDILKNRTELYLKEQR